MTARARYALTTVGVLAAVVVVSAAWLAWSYYGTVDIGSRTVTVIIEPGDSFQAVADTLLAQGVVKSSLLLRWPARLSGLDRALTAGRYDFTGRNSCRSVLQRLRDADYLRVRVTIPEGSPIWRVGAILRTRLDLDSAELVRLNRDSAFLAAMSLPCLEGYLFPATYVFKWGTPLGEVVNELVRVFREKTEGIWPEQLPLGLTREEVIILASIVEAETMRAEENATVASVYANRLRSRMKLDADPTVIYGLGGLNRPLMRRDLREDTPYNTYLRRGLPPTPINSPSLSAIQAAIAPAQTDFLYFVADGTGGHVFSRTNAEHNRARQRIKRAMNQTGG